MNISEFKELMEKGILEERGLLAGLPSNISMSAGNKRYLMICLRRGSDYTEYLEKRDGAFILAKEFALIEIEEGKIDVLASLILTKNASYSHVELPTIEERIKKVEGSYYPEFLCQIDPAGICTSLVETASVGYSGKIKRTQ